MLNWGTTGLHSVNGRFFAGLAMEGEISQVKLAEFIGVEGPTLVRILDRMEQKGWIKRKVSSRDRRQKLISPTKKVEGVWRKMTECAHGVRRGRRKRDFIKRYCEASKTFRKNKGESEWTNMRLKSINNCNGKLHYPLLFTVYTNIPRYFCIPGM